MAEAVGSVSPNVGGQGQHSTRATTPSKLSMFDRALVGPAIVDSFRKLYPRVQWRNPVMFVVYVGSILTTLLWFQAALGQGEAP
jgi:potassium-transporting ATPase ATP-binding subunit